MEEFYTFVERRTHFYNFLETRKKFFISQLWSYLGEDRT